MVDTLVLDIETKRLIRDIGRDPRRMPELGVSLIGVYSYERGEFIVYHEDQFLELEELLKQAGQVVGFNLKGFDYPVLQGHLDFDFTKIQTVDVMEDIRRVISRRISLNEVAGATLGVQKSADGLQAVRYYHEGKWEELEKYCLSDVRITRDLFDFGRRNKHVKVPGSYGLGSKNIRVNWRLLEAGFSGSFSDASQAPLF
ncbi:ribonuclease H-like domain-containing protein [Patescibacteria group bacterium]|nr:ribonuclease H-like domain-containing protein [Patescibacteria group bacterium]MBU1868134.1 ribonuclease H-like domain-containing protein [Patescibacteria group bacterium]